MDVKRFERSPAGRLVRAGEGNAAYVAFVPRPLPPAYEPATETIYTLSQADRALGELAGLSRIFPNPHLLIRPFIRREAVLSSKIEGTQANIEDLYRYEIGQLFLPGLKDAEVMSDVKEVFNYVRALEYGLKRLTDFPLSLRFIRELHGILLEGVRGGYATPGEFRRTQNWIGAPGSTLNSAIFVPPPFQEMQQALNDFEHYLHLPERVPPLLRLAFIHYQFEAIHPFIDGNGRIGRLLITLLLVHWGILPAPLLYLSVFFEKHRDRYYDLLLQISERGAWEEWMQFFLTGVTEQANDAVRRARAIEELQERWRKQVIQERLSAVAVSVLAYLLEQPIVTAAAVRDHVDIPHNTAIRILRRLAALGILELYDTSARNQQFVATDLLHLLGE